MKLKFYPLVVLLGLLLVCGCKKKEMTIEDLPPDPEVCAEMEELTSQGSDPFYDYAQKAAEKGCIRRMFKAIGGVDENWELLVAIFKKDETKAKEIIAQRGSADGFALSSAVYLNEKSVVEEILKTNIKPEEIWWGTMSSMFDGSPEDSVLELMQKLIKHKFDLNYRRKECGTTLWIFAKSHNYQRVVQVLEANGVQPTKDDKDVALGIAAVITSFDGKTKGKPEVVKALVREGADINGTPKCWTASIYQRVKEKGTPEMIELFKSYGAHD